MFSLSRPAAAICRAGAPVDSCGILGKTARVGVTERGASLQIRSKIRTHQADSRQPSASQTFPGFVAFVRFRLFASTASVAMSHEMSLIAVSASMLMVNRDHIRANT
jgi:hypothetical protein